MIKLKKDKKIYEKVHYVFEDELVGYDDPKDRPTADFNEEETKDLIEYINSPLTEQEKKINERIKKSRKVLWINGNKRRYI